MVIPYRPSARLLSSSTWMRGSRSKHLPFRPIEGAKPPFYMLALTGRKMFNSLLPFCLSALPPS